MSKIFKVLKRVPSLLIHDYNPRYSGGRDRRILLE
jgi:hypothetical protein